MYSGSIGWLLIPKVPPARSAVVGQSSCGASPGLPWAFAACAEFKATVAIHDVIS